MADAVTLTLLAILLLRRRFRGCARNENSVNHMDDTFVEEDVNFNDVAIIDGEGIRSTVDDGDWITLQSKRGINSIQLLKDQGRWWVVSIFWMAETEEFPIPSEYLQ